MTPEEIIEGNKLIAEFMGVLPEIEYCVGSEEKDTTCYSHKNCYFETPAGQKAECERWLKEQAEKYPNGWVTKEGYTTRRFELYPWYNSQWNQLMPVCKKIVDMYKDNRQDIFSALHKCDIDAIWVAVVEFIQFWNDPNSIIETWSNVPYPYDPMPKGRIRLIDKYQTKGGNQ